MRVHMENFDISPSEIANLREDQQAGAEPHDKVDHKESGAPQDQG